MRATASMMLCVLLAVCPAAFALDPSVDANQYAHAAWTVRAGFAKGPVRSVAQTPDGYLWLGTDFGLLRFDGVRAVAWQPPAGEQLAGNAVVKVLASRDGTLWIGSSKGLASWKEGKLTHYPELAGRLVRALVEDQDGTLWAGGFTPPGSPGRLCAIADRRARCSDLAHGVMGLYEDSRRTLWVSQFEGLWRWTPSRPEFFPTGARMRSPVIETDDGALLISTSDGLRRFANGKFEEYSIGIPTPQPGATAFLRDRDGGLWMGIGVGLAHLHRGRTDIFNANDGLSGNTVNALFEDREGNIWAATDGGLDRFRDLAVQTFSTNQGFVAGRPGSIQAAADGSLWFGTPDRLINWRDWRMTVYQGPSGNAGDAIPTRVVRNSGLPPELQALLQDAGGRLWVTALGVFGYLDGDKFIPMKAVPGQETAAIAEGARGDLWISFNDNLFHVVDGRLVEQIPGARLGMRGHVDGRIAVDLHGGLWIGFRQGGVAYLRNGRIERSYATVDGMGEGRVSHVRLDHRGALWVATEGGVSRIKDGHVATLSTRNGLPCNAAHWSQEDVDNSLWIYLECGLARVVASETSAWAEDSNRSVHATVLDAFDGVAAKTVAFGAADPPVTQSRDGRIWFSVQGGVSVVDPRRISSNRLAPPVHIEQVTADHRSYGASPRLQLAPLIRNLQIDYTALSFVAPEKNQFRYKLEGRDGDWQDAGNRRQAFYTDLDPGHYRFRVIAANSSGVWNEQGATLEFSIAPAYWQTNWFRALCVAAFLALLWTLYLLRVHQLARQFNRTLEARVNERTRIARDLHDTLLQSFHGLLLRFQTARDMFASRPGDALEVLDGAIDQAADAITEGRDAVQGLRTSTEETNDLADAIRTLGGALAAEEGVDRGIALRIDVQGGPRELHPIVRDELVRIAGEAMRNAFRHAEAKQIEVEIRYDDRRLRLRVRDDGKGIAAETLKAGAREGHFGLPGMRERARLIGAKLTVWSRDDQGTEVEVSVPATHAYASPPAAATSWRARLARALKLQRQR